MVAANEIEPELFVFFADDDAYSHVAGVDDLRIYPSNKAEAVSQERPFYRAAHVELVLHSQPLAVSAAAGIQARLALVNRDWGAIGTAPFGGVDTFIYDSREP